METGNQIERKEKPWSWGRNHTQGPRMWIPTTQLQGAFESCLFIYYPQIEQNQTWKETNSQGFF